MADKGYHSKQALEGLAEVGVRTVIAEPERKRQQWTGQSAVQAAVYANRRRLNTKTAKALMRRARITLPHLAVHDMLGVFP